MNTDDKKKIDEEEKQELEEELLEEADAEIAADADSASEASSAKEAGSGDPREEADESDVEVEDEAKRLEAQLKRAVADYQNLEKRTQENKKEWILSANKDLILRLLPGLDNLLLAEMHTEDKGIKIAIKHFMDILEQEGVKKIKTEGEEFDPNLMEAVTTGEGDEGKVIQEVKAGYTLNENVLRVAQVIVGSGKQSN